jgi:hypothetical protein
MDLQKVFTAAPDEHRRHRWSTAGLVVGGIHLLLSVAATVFLVYMLVWRTGHSKFAGVYLVMLGLPWNFLFAFLFTPVFGQAALDRLPMVVSVSFMFGAAAINSAIAYLVGAILGSTGSGDAA